MGGVVGAKGFSIQAQLDQSRQGGEVGLLLGAIRNGDSNYLPIAQLPRRVHPDCQGAGLTKQQGEELD